jgi:hypothetical protein
MLRKLRLKAAAAAGAAVVTASFGAAAIGAQPALASATHCVSGGCDLFQNGPDNGYFFTTPGLTPVTMICWTDAQWYDGTNRWFKISDIYGTGTNWTSADEVANQTTVGHC